MIKNDSPLENPIICNQEACISCGICSKVCLFSVIVMDGNTGMPVISPLAPPCSKCGHCEAFCPRAVIRISGYDRQESSPILTENAISKDQIRNLLLSRRSIRKYQKKLVPRETLEEILGAVKYAPSAMNLQTVRWQILYDPEIVHNLGLLIAEWMKQMQAEQRLDEFAIGSSFPYIISEWEKGRDLITHGAPHLLITYAAPDEPTAPTDAIIATSYLDLMAPVFHLGTCWAGILKRAAEWSPDVLATMDLPQESLPQTAMLIGYPAYQQYTVPGRKPADIHWKG